MSDVLIREVPDDVVAAIDAHAASVGLSRSEYLRRKLRQDADRSTTSVAVSDLRGFGDTFRDLADPRTMNDAWS